jgi:threonine/homoserine efflux transporter RhtA
MQMLPVSVNGFGVREATFSFYFAQLHLPLESALALSFTGAAMIMLFSTSGAVAYLVRRTHHHQPHAEPPPAG